MTAIIERSLEALNSGNNLLKSGKYPVNSGNNLLKSGKYPVNGGKNLLVTNHHLGF
ncbi:Surfactin synthase subunit 1 [Moritella viscosa]|nr:Surfactin synthase subunit 1 [Moritella viscosa]